MPRHPKSESGLTDKQEAFCREYIVDLNGTRAAIRAGFSEHTASEQAVRLLKDPNVSAFVQKLMDARSKRVEIKSDDVLGGLKKLSESDLRKLFAPNGTLLPVPEWPDDVAPCVSSVEVEELFEMVNGERVWTGYTKKIKFWDKPKSFELLGKHKKLFTDRVEHSGEVEISSKLAKARKRVKE